MAGAGDPARRGTLYLVATPIGNLEDLSPRAIRILREVDLIAAEDTRRTGRLLQRFGVARPLRSYYDAVEHERAPELVEAMVAGRSVALVSDAGTPGIADPGYRLVTAAIAADVPVVPIPGPSALTAFLPATGLPTDRFAFEGFLPARRSERRKRITALVHEPRTIVFYESARRLPDALADLAELLGPRPAAIGRELTKLHEEIVRGALDDLATCYRREPATQGEEPARQVRGELVVAVAGAPDDSPSVVSEDLADEIRRRRNDGMSVREVAETIARERGLKRRMVYRLALMLER